MASKKNLLVIIDCFALIHRAFHAFPDSLATSEGEVVNAVYGFSSLVLDVLLKFQPSHVICVFDAPGPTIRNQQFVDYKAHRGPADESMVSQLPRIREFIENLNVPLLEVQGFEADDIIGTLSKQFESAANHETIIVTGDRDIFQLVDHNTKVYLAGSSFSQSKLYDADGVKEKMGVLPIQITDIKALEGDASDNIPGVAGIGKKGAVDLVVAFNDLENIYKNIDKLPNRYRQKLIDQQEMAYLSKKLATIITDVPLSYEFTDAEFKTFDPKVLKEFCAKLEFRSLMGKVDKLIEKYHGKSDEFILGDLASQMVVEETIANLKEWNGEDLCDEVFVLIESEGNDSLDLKLTYLCILNEGDVYFVAEKDMGIAMDKLAGCKLVVANDAKTLLKFAKLSSWYDLPIAGSVISGGIFKPVFADLIEKYSGTRLADMSREQIVYAMKEIYKLQKVKLEKDSRTQAILDLEMKVSPVVGRMEQNGIKVDSVELGEFQEELENKLNELIASIYADVGHEFNIASPKQVGEILFGERNLPGGKKTKSGTYSTDERTLRDLIGVDPVIEKILSFREISKLLSTYIKPLPSYINPKTKRIHGNFNQIGAVTGRFSSDRPNLQNIPIGEGLGQNIRKAFIADKGKIFVSFDYSQQELRLLAELSGEKRLIEAFNSGEDIHARTAADLFDIDIKAVDKNQRRIGKTVNFGIIYGMGTFGLADRLKIPTKQAAEFIEKYFIRYPNVSDYFEKLLAGAKEEGFVYTILGRRKSTAMLNAGNYMLREAAKREVMNFPLQGSAADFMKVAMVNIDKVINKYPAKIVLQIHDEVILEYDCKEQSEEALLTSPEFKDFIDKIHNAMLQVADLSVELDVDAQVGYNWLEMKDIKL